MVPRAGRLLALSMVDLTLDVLVLLQAYVKKVETVFLPQHNAVQMDNFVGTGRIGAFHIVRRPLHY